MPRRLISTGSPFEKTAGYSRAVIDGDFAFVSGTTGYDYATMTMPADVTSQTRNCFKTIEAALQEGGFALADIVRATYYVTRRRGCRRRVRGLRRKSRRDPPRRNAAGRRRSLKPEMKIEIEVTAKRRSPDPSIAIASLLPGDP